MAETPEKDLKSAFPHKGNTHYHPGLSTREYFACHIMAGMRSDDSEFHKKTYYDSSVLDHDLAAMSIVRADALIKALEGEDG